MVPALTAERRGAKGQVGLARARCMAQRGDKRCGDVLFVAGLGSVVGTYLERFRQDAPFINAGLEQVPTGWLNQRLVELGERWQVDGDDTFRALRSLDH